MNAKTEDLFFSGDHLFLCRFCPLKIVISKKKRSLVRGRLDLGWYEVNAECRSKDIVFGLVFNSRL